VLGAQPRGTPIYDAVAVDLLDAADPLAGVVDTEDIGGAINVAILGRFDLVANDTLWVTAASWLDLSRRTIRLDAVQIASRATGTYESASTWTMAFDQVQAGLSTLGNVTAVGCGLAGAGMQAVQINAAGIVTGTAIPAVDTVAHDAADDHDVCEYDHVEYMFYAGDSADEHLDYYAFDFGTDTLYSYASDAFPWMITDAEVATDNGFVGVAIGDLDGGNYLYLRAAGTSGSPDDSVFTSSGAPIAALDVSVSPAGIPYVCAVDSVGNASLLWADVLGIPSPALTSVPLTSTDLGAIDDCAVIVTADSVAVFALRGGDDLALGALRVP
jgi:hypothetical protein